MESEIEIKTVRLASMLAAENLGGVLINAQHNFAWLTGGKSNGINLSGEAGACFLLVRRDGKRFVLANNIEMPRMLAEEISAADFEPIEFRWQDEKSAGDFVIEQAKKLLGAEEILVSDSVLHNQTRAVENLIAACRFELTGAEIARYRNLGKDAGAAVGNLFATLPAGITEIEIARRTKDALAAYRINPVVTLIGADERIEKFRHPIPTENVWKKMISIAVCAKREGLIVNLSRIACAGEIPAALKAKTEAAAFVFARLCAATTRGQTGAQLYRIAAGAYAEKGFAGEIDRHHQGGATGYKTRDWVAHPKSTETVRRHQAFAWNPTITGTKIEETFIAGENGAEIITASPNFPHLSVEIDGREFLCPNILNL